MGLKLHIPSPSYRTTTQEMDGYGGTLVTDRVLESRKLSAIFVSKAANYIHSLELRDKLYSIFGNGRHFYVSETERPNKRWKVYLDEWTPERFDVRTHTFDIPLLVESGVSESINIIKKSFTTSGFRFKNDGDINIDPRIHSETEFELVGVSTNPTIRNLTTGDEWKYTGSTVVSDTIVLKGVRTLKNNVSVFKDTNKKLITMIPGWNDFQLIGVTDGNFNLTIKTRFYFL